MKQNNLKYKIITFLSMYLIMVACSFGSAMSGSVYKATSDVLDQSGVIQGGSTYKSVNSIAQPNAGVQAGSTYYVQDGFLYTISSSAGGVSGPIAGFYGSPTSGIGPFTVNFVDTSANSPTHWSWNFGDGKSTTIENPSHQYAAVGSPTFYTVTLIVSNSIGTSTSIHTNYVYVSTTSAGLAPVLTNAPSMKAFIGFGLSSVFNLEDYNSGGLGTSYSLPVDFLSLGTTLGSYESQAAYGSATTGTNSYEITNTAGSSTSSGLIKYSTYRIQRLPIVGLTAGSHYDLNVENFTYNSSGVALPPSFGNPTSLSVSNLSDVTAYWVNDSVVRITSLQSFTGDVVVNVTASPVVPAGTDQDVESIDVYSNMLSNSTFSTANDTTTWSPMEIPPGRTTMASQQWIPSYTDANGVQANGVWKFTFADANGGVKSTPAQSDWIATLNGQWYTYRMRLVADSTNNSHEAILFGYTNYVGDSIQTDIVGHVLFGVPTVWTWMGSPLLAHGNGTTAYPQFQFKAGGAGSIYVDEIQIINAAPELVDARSNTQFHYLYGQFTAGIDTTGWGQQVYTGAGSAPEISVNNGLLLNFAGAGSGSAQEGIKWTANNGVQGPNHAYTFPVHENYEVGARLTLTIESGSFNSLGIVLVAIYGVQTAGQQNIGIPVSDLLAVAGVGVLEDGSYRASGLAYDPYYQGQFGIRSDLPGTLLINDVDMDVDNDDPNFGDPTLFP
jgi:PKD repeat protein